MLAYIPYMDPMGLVICYSLLLNMAHLDGYFPVRKLLAYQKVLNEHRRWYSFMRMILIEYSYCQYQWYLWSVLNDTSWEDQSHKAMRRTKPLMLGYASQLSSVYYYPYVTHLSQNGNVDSIHKINRSIVLNISISYIYIYIIISYACLVPCVFHNVIIYIHIYISIASCGTGTFGT